MKYLVILILISGCGRSTLSFHQRQQAGKIGRQLGVHKILPDKRKSGIDRELQPYVGRFSNLCDRHVGVPVNFGASLELGSCSEPLIVDGRREINREEWNNNLISPKYTETLREWIVFHELGHCVLLRDHNSSTTTLPDGEQGAVSLMVETIDPYMVLDFYNNYDYYINELCGE